MLKVFRKRTQPINYTNIFCLWHIYRAIGNDVPVVITPGGYDDDDNGLITTMHQAIKSPYTTEPIRQFKQFKKASLSK